MNAAAEFSAQIKERLRGRLTGGKTFAAALLARAERASEAAAALYVGALAGVPESSLELQRDALQARMSALKAAGAIELVRQLQGAIEDVRNQAWSALLGDLAGIPEVEGAPRVEPSADG